MAPSSHLFSILSYPKHAARCSRPSVLCMHAAVGQDRGALLRERVQALDGLKLPPLTAEDEASFAASFATQTVSQ
eukprot:764856-Rhodomonas_salina.2